MSLPFTELRIATSNNSRCKVLTKSTTKKRNYVVGYAKPPEQTRFKKGQSGNPAGRPKATLNFASVIERALLEKVVFHKRGQRKELTKLEAGATQLADKVAAGDLRALNLIFLRLEEKSSDEESSTPASESSDNQQDRYKTLVENLREIYGLNDWPDESKPFASAPAIKELDGAAATPNDRHRG